LARLNVTLFFAFGIRACRQLTLWEIFDGFFNKIFHACPQDIVEYLDQGHAWKSF
jgi:hypothetical protein